MDVIIDTLGTYGWIWCILLALIVGGVCSFFSKSGSNETPTDSDTTEYLTVTCPVCDGEGIIQDPHLGSLSGCGGGVQCPECGGSGYVKEAQ